jgi:hypothetical protein
MLLAGAGDANSRHLREKRSSHCDELSAHSIGLMRVVIWRLEARMAFHTRAIKTGLRHAAEGERGPPRKVAGKGNQQKRSHPENESQGQPEAVHRATIVELIED